MPAPRNIEEAMERAPILDGSKLALRFAKEVSGELVGILEQVTSEHQQMMLTVEQDLGKKLEIEVVQPQTYSDEVIVDSISRLLCSSDGLRQLASLRRVLSGLSGADDAQNARRTLQVLAWLKTGDEANKFSNKMLILTSKLEQIPAMIERSLRTPVGNWEQEVRELFDTGGGINCLWSMFEGTPIEGITDVIAKSLMGSLELRELSAKAGRSREDMQLEASIYNRMTQASAHLGKHDLDRYERAEATYRNFQSELESMKVGEGQQMDREYMVRLERLTRANKKALAEFQKYEKRVQTNPDKIESMRVNLCQSLRMAESFGDNEIRYTILERQLRQNALLRVNQVILVLSKMSSLYSEQVIAANRAMQERTISSLGSLFASSGLNMAIVPA